VASAPHPGPCAECPRRAGNDPDLADIDPDVCTDPTCWDHKLAAHVQAEIEAREAEGFEVLRAADVAQLWPTKHWESPRGFDGLEREVWGEGEDALPAPQAVAELEGVQGIPELPKPVWVESPHGQGLVKVWRAADAETLRKLFYRFLCAGAGAGGDEGDDGASTPSTAGAGARDGANVAEATAGWSDDERALLDCERLLALRRAILAAIPGRARTVDDLRAMCHAHLSWADDLGPGVEILKLDVELAAARQAHVDVHGDDDDFNEAAWWSDWIDRADPDTLASVLLIMAVDELIPRHLRFWFANDDQVRARRVLRVAAQYGVDPAAVVVEQEDGCNG